MIAGGAIQHLFWWNRLGIALGTLIIVGLIIIFGGIFLVPNRKIQTAIQKTGWRATREENQYILLGIASSVTGFFIVNSIG